ncbi:MULTISPECIES: substrate-binding and VWA domain-containing protein [Thermomonospora]|uniref:substrate-binding and VWA domain-containing protein n=1 Tax=Thermomonospora TaxID=2019 RepID=UPI00145E4A0F|nr:MULTISPECIES: substrate-binding and VWA domain-containing protein [Thermomonospora]
MSTVAATLLVGGGVYAFAGSLNCAARGTLDLNVTVAPELEPALRSAAQRFNDRKQVAEGRCIKVTVHPADPQAVATLLSGTGTSRGAERVPDVWIPDSSLWAARSAPGGSQPAARMPQPGTSIAETPIVIGAGKSVRGLAAASRPSWEGLLGSDRARSRTPDPNRSAIGLGMLMAVRMSLAGDSKAVEKFTGLVRSVRQGVVPDVQTQFAAGTGDRLLVTSEQAVLRHNRDHPGERLQILRPAEGTLALDYPYTPIAAALDKTTAARLFEREVRSAATRRDLRALGFRTDRSDGGVRLLPLPEAEQVQQTLQAWAKLSLTSRMLSLLDISGSMLQRVPGTGDTRMQVLAKAAQLGLKFQPDDTELGQWVFSTKLDGDRDWKETVPVGPLGERLGSGTRRQQILSSLASLQPKPDGDTGLYDTVLAALSYMRKTYKPDMVNTVLLMTDGRNDDDDGPTLRQTLAKLRAGHDPERPVQLVIIGFGDEVDRKELQQLAEATGGSVHFAKTAEDMRNIFLAGTSRRVCAPKC